MGHIKNRNHKKEHLKDRYNMSLEDYQSMLDGQDNKCKLCNIVLDSSCKALKPHIDHCHITGVIRGMLCHNCNAGLGHFKDSIVLLDKAKEYLNGY